MREFSALDVLGVAAGVSSPLPLIEVLKTHAINDETYESECWQVVCARLQRDVPPATVASEYRSAVIETFPRCRPAVPVDNVEPLVTLIKTYAIKCSYASYADSYVAAMLKAKVPPELTSLVPRDLPPYQHVASHFAADCNDVVRPILKTPLRTVLAEATWGEHDLQGMFAAVVTLRELTGGVPNLYINTELAAADDEPGVFALNCLIAGGGIGVVHHRELFFYDTPLQVLMAWLVAAKNDSRVQELAGKVL